MPRLDVVLLCFIIQGFIGQQSTAHYSQVVYPLQWSYGENPIGKGVHLNAHVFYDSGSYQSMAPQANVTEYFKKIFNQTQQHFKNHSILVKIVVHNITLNNSAEVPGGTPNVLNGSATIKNLQQYAKNLGLSNDSVVYLYTNKTPVDRSFYSVFPSYWSTVTTFGSFCTKNNSAAIVVQQPGKDSYWHTVQATAELFGVKNFINFTLTDIETMKKTFQNCHVEKQDINGQRSNDDD
uniref:Putative 28 kDa metastriate family member n=1 Tax=Rhipicephalus pulchellus TaxID=72859 RepID=L7MBN2_RHIPC